MWPFKYKLAIEASDQYLRVTVKGTYGFGRSRRLIHAVRELSDRHHLRRILADVTGVTGVPPDIDRFELGERIAEVFGSTHTLAVIAREEAVNRLAETVAQNRGAALRVFLTEQEALTWLLPVANVKVGSVERGRN
ncbi:MAG TPA: hypothetical protein VEU54_04650 [Steroidobacteraceae bacterium]|nr:hypothetical protein [Steroidobacteraceae bacterium]